MFTTRLLLKSAVRSVFYIFNGVPASAWSTELNLEENCSLIVDKPAFRSNMYSLHIAATADRCALTQKYSPRVCVLVQSAHVVNMFTPPAGNVSPLCTSGAYKGRHCITWGRQPLQNLDLNRLHNFLW